MPCGASATCCASRAVFPSIRAQLTAWLALLVTLCLATFAVYLYVAVGQLLTADLDQTLRVQAQQVAVTYHFDASDSGDEDKDEQHVDTSVGNQLAAARVLAEVFDTQGHMLATSSNLEQWNLLLLARGDEARTIDRRPVELDVLLLEVARQARTLAQGVSVTIGHEDQALVRGDVDLLKQLLLNLVDNALTYTSPGGQVTLALSVADGQARLAVQDTGPGIAPADLARIFERFYRLDRARSRRSGGAGLGLAIARWIAEAHGGRIEGESTVGQGSTFTVVMLLSNRSVTRP